MASLRNPVLIWRDSAGGFTATLLGDWPAAAYGDSEDDAMRQLRELLQWRSIHEPWAASSDLAEPTLVQFQVDIRPQYDFEEGRKIVPCPESLRFQIPCVVGTQENGLPVCVIPHLGLRFTYEDRNALRSLVNHFVNEAMQGQSPLELAGSLPPTLPTLTEVVIQDEVRPRRTPRMEQDPYRLLSRIADPLLVRSPRQSWTSAYGRDILATRLAQLLGHESSHLLLVGESGVGKTTVLMDAARRASREKVVHEDSGDTEEHQDSSGQYRFWRGSGAKLVAGMRYLGQWEERCESFIQQLHGIEGIFCAEGLLELVQIGGQGPGDSVAGFFLPYMQRGELRMVAEATPDEVEACRRLLPAFLDLFQVIPVPAFEESEAQDVLNRVAQAHSKALRIGFPTQSVTLVHNLFRRHLPYTVQPGPAVEFIHSLLQERTRQSAGNKPQTLSGTTGQDIRSVTPEQVLAAFIRRTGLPEFLLRDDQPLSLEAVRAYFSERIIGQPAAVDIATRVVATIKAGLSDPGRPAAVLFFCGPTGVGKTALAQTIAAYCFGASGEKNRLIRLDLSEYSGPGAAHRLLYAGSGEPAEWLQRLRAQPFSVLLFDEVEKAAPEIFDTLLGVLDEGRLADNYGRVTQFRSAIIVLTSNIGSSQNAALGFGVDLGPDFGAEVQRFFRPEFFNRLDDVVTFQPLTQAHVREITRKELAELSRREGLAASNLTLEYSAALEEAVARAGYDHRLGTRPLQRALERLVVVPLAHWLMRQKRVQGVLLRLDMDSAGQLLISTPPDESETAPID